MKKALTILLTAVMLLGLFVQTAVAADERCNCMKKFLPLVLALLMLLSLVACGEKTPAASNEKNEDTQQSEQTTTNPGSEAQTSQPDESTQDTSSGYHFEGYTETADWPAADMWESFGLPELILTDDVSGCKISAVPGCFLWCAARS